MDVKSQGVETRVENAHRCAYGIVERHVERYECRQMNRHVWKRAYRRVHFNDTRRYVTISDLNMLQESVGELALDETVCTMHAHTHACAHAHTDGNMHMDACTHGQTNAYTHALDEQVIEVLRYIELHEYSILVITLIY